MVETGCENIMAAGHMALWFAYIISALNLEDRGTSRNIRKTTPLLAVGNVRNLKLTAVIWFDI